MTEEKNKSVEKQTVIEAKPVTDSAILMTAFDKIGIDEKLGKRIFESVSQVGGGEAFKMNLYELKETKSGRPALLIELEDHQSQIIAKIAMDGRKTVVCGRTREKNIGRLTGVFLDKQGKLVLFDEQKNPILLNLRSVLK